MAAAPTTYKELEQLLRERFERLTPHQQRLAQRTLSDPEGCAFQTVTELAESVGVNESTVVRFATALGLRGYPELARLCQQRLREKAQLLERFEALHYLESVDEGALARAASFDQANIARTFANIDEQAWDEAVRALAAARIVQVVGLRKSFAPATLFRYLLGLVRDEVYQLGAVHGTLPDALRRLRPGDVLVGIAIHRYVRETVQALEFARRHGVTTIALTDNASSPLVRHADVVFYVEVAGVSILRSVTAVVSLVQALVGAVAMALGAHTRSALLLEEELLAEFNVYLAEPEDGAATPTGPGRSRASRSGTPRRQPPQPAGQVVTGSERSEDL
jgi:DNA-binding MurR/RpiR family transcriptional regulator